MRVVDQLQFRPCQESILYILIVNLDRVGRLLAHRVLEFDLNQVHLARNHVEDSLILDLDGPCHLIDDLLLLELPDLFDVFHLLVFLPVGSACVVKDA